MLGIERISAPTLRVWYQKGFDENQEDDAEQYLLEMGLYKANEMLLQAMGGREAGTMFTLVTEVPAKMDDAPVEWRRRIQATVVKQFRQQNFDSRYLQRSRLLGDRQGDAIRAMRALQKRQPDIAPVAVQLETEASLNMELLTKQFNMPDFILQSKEWTDQVKDSILRLKRS